MTWNTDAEEFGRAVAEFEAALPGFWWSVGQCSVGAHASCSVDANGAQAHLLEYIKQAGDPMDDGFHCDTRGGAPHEALRNVMQQALDYIRDHCPPCTTKSDLSARTDHPSSAIASFGSGGQHP